MFCLSRIWWSGALALLIASVCVPATAQDPTDGEIAAFFDDYVGRSLEEGGVPGAALVVVRDGRVILSKAYGAADLASGEPLTVDRHLLRQGSISKVATWLMVMQLVEEGKIDLDRDVNAYLPFRIEAKFGRPITMRHLMTHSAGFAERFMGVFGKPRAGLCETLATTLPERVAAPGARISYSNSGAGLAACIVERVTGRPFDQAVRERVLAPAGMTAATFAQPPGASARWPTASQYPASADTPKGMEYIALRPVGALNATGTDMGRLLLALMSGGQGPNGRIAPPQALAGMLELEKPLLPGLSSGFGKGFIVREWGPHRIVGHGGTMMSAITDMEIIPDLGVGYYIGMTGLGFGGSATGIRAALPGAVLDRFLPAKNAPRAFGPSSAAEMEGYWLPGRRYRSGVLKMSNLNLIKLSADADGSLRIDTATGPDGEPLRWLPQGRDRFVESKSGTPLVAVRDGSGRIVRFASTIVDPVGDVERSSAWLAAALPLFALSSGLIVLAGLAFPATALVRRLRRRPAPHRTAPDGRARRAAAIGIAYFVALLFGWCVFMVVISDDPYRLTTAQLPLRIAGFFTLLSPLAAIAIIYGAATALRSRRIKAGLWYATIGLAAMVLIVLFHVLGMASLSTDF